MTDVPIPNLGTGCWGGATLLSREPEDSAGPRSSRAEKLEARPLPLCQALRERKEPWLAGGGRGEWGMGMVRTPRRGPSPLGGGHASRSGCFPARTEREASLLSPQSRGPAEPPFCAGISPLPCTVSPPRLRPSLCLLRDPLLSLWPWDIKS